MELLQNGLIFGSLLAVVAVAVWRHARRNRQRVPLVLVALAAMIYLPLVVAADLGTVLLLLPLEPLPEPSMTLLALLPAVVVALAWLSVHRRPRLRRALLLVPLLAVVLFAQLLMMVHGHTEGTVYPILFGLLLAGATAGLFWVVRTRGAALHPRGAVALLPLALLAVMSAAFETALLLDKPSRTEHRWTVEVTPLDDALPYEVRVPFLGPATALTSSEGDRVRAAIGHLAGVVRVVNGDIRPVFVEEGRAVTLEGRGHAVLAGTVALYAFRPDRAWPLPVDEQVALASGGPSTMRVAWTLELRLEASGQPCSFSAQGMAIVEAGGTATLDGADPFSTGIDIRSDCVLRP